MIHCLFNYIIVYEKEINLLKQSEFLLKSQEDSKNLEVATTIQSKLSQKNAKIEALKSKLNSADTKTEATNKVCFFLILE